MHNLLFSGIIFYVCNQIIHVLNQITINNLVKRDEIRYLRNAFQYISQIIQLL